MSCILYLPEGHSSLPALSLHSSNSSDLNFSFIHSFIHLFILLFIQHFRGPGLQTEGGIRQGPGPEGAHRKGGQGHHREKREQHVLTPPWVPRCGVETARGRGSSGCYQGGSGKPPHKKAHEPCLGGWRLCRADKWRQEGPLGMEGGRAKLQEKARFRRRAIAGPGWALRDAGRDVRMQSRAGEQGLAGSVGLHTYGVWVW